MKFLTTRALVALAATAAACIGGFAFVASVVCGVTAGSPHGHGYAVAGWVFFTLAATLLTTGVVLGLVADNLPRE